MDLLYQRYASPFSFVNGMIQIGRFCSFVEEFISTINSENEEKTQWEYFLHKVFEGSYADFKDEVQLQKKMQSMSLKTIEETVNSSLSILKNFKPDDN